MGIGLTLQQVEGRQGQYHRMLKAQWGYLKKGVMIEFPKHGLIHYEAPEPDLQLIERVKGSTAE